MSLPAAFLRIESAVIFATAVITYVHFHYSGWLFLILFFTPDVSLLGYIINTRVGAVVYNVIHNFSLPLIGLLLSMFLRADPLVAYCLIWTAHVAFDRVIGFGLMHPDRFGNSNVANISLYKLHRRLRRIE